MIYMYVHKGLLSFTIQIGREFKHCLSLLSFMLLLHCILSVVLLCYIHTRYIWIYYDIYVVYI